MQKFSHKKPRKGLIDVVIIKSWWVFLVVSGTFLWGVHAVNLKNQEINDLEGCLHEVHKEKCFAMSEKEELLLKLNSQNDPAWIEQILMGELGLVPEGYTKVHFNNAH